MDKKNIMIVEDEAIVALKIKADLLKAGHTVHGIYPSGEAALKAARTSPPDLALMDIQLQGEMDGVETAGALSRELDVPVIFMTAHSDEGTIERAAQAGPYSYLLKPVDSMEMLISVQVAVLKHEADKEKEKLLQELKHALEEVKTLKGMIPICYSCKKIRDDKGYWERIEEYISRHSDAQFSHGICPDCLKKLYPEYADIVKEEKPDDKKK